ncbi:phenylalanine--tRNA ligase beta subunit-related protein [uncultured Salinibacterium sp.]|uniref:B3/B4 domain-containing protein n=1 Tax=uncultured Salinibacterium sp. TaxID=459274 RepID=UPI0030DD5D65|tara:strand:+ start:106954 stop:107673 length:720 start_codon:yes stop_codon:yes gene_type:complete
MSNAEAHETFLNSATVDPAVFELRPDYRALLLVIEGLDAAPSNTASDDLIHAAEAYARSLLADRPVEELPHVAVWREAYRAFGAKPQRTRNSLEALTRRAAEGLPRVNPLTDIYNAISVLHQVPVGGEDLALYAGPARLARALGDEPFEAFANGEAIVDHPSAGEVVWRDDAGVTCRRWNWRQGPRTALSDGTTTGFFIFDALEPMTDDALRAAGDALVTALSAINPAVSVSQRLVTAQ